MKISIKQVSEIRTPKCKSNTENLQRTGQFNVSTNVYVDGPRARAAGTENICSTPTDRGAIIKIQFGSPEQHHRQGPNDTSN